jgi:hypothetical protein
MSNVPYESIESAIQQVSLDPYSSFPLKLVVVVDADALLSSIDNHCRSGNRPRLLRIAASRGACAYAEDHVYGEVYRGFRRIAASTSISVGELRACFEEHYLPLLRWVKTDAAGITDERVARVTDQTDVPTAELASLIAPCVVLSQDKSLRRPGFAPEEWRLAAGHGVQVVEGADMQEAAVMVMSLPVLVVLGGGIQLGKAARIPWWASLVLMGVGGYALLRSSERRRVVANGAELFIEGIGEALSQAAAREQAGVHLLKRVRLEPAWPPTAKQQVASVLARQRQPLLATEIHESIQRHFEDCAPALAAVRAVIKASPEFTQPERYRWQLGRISGPWSGSLVS